MQARKTGAKAFVESTSKPDYDHASKVNSVGKGRYSNKAEALSNGFEEISRNRHQKYGSHSLAKPRVSEGLPLRRDTDSAASRQRNTIKQLEKI